MGKTDQLQPWQIKQQQRKEKLFELRKKPIPVSRKLQRSYARAKMERDGIRKPSRYLSANWREIAAHKGKVGFAPKQGG